MEEKVNKRGDYTNRERTKFSRICWIHQFAELVAEVWVGVDVAVDAGVDAGVDADVAGGTVSLGSFIPSSNSFFTLFLASLNSRIPRPIPRMNSGIFLPPKRIRTARIIRIHSDPPGADIRNK